MQIFPNIDKSKLDDFYKNIGINVKKYRIEKNVSQLELAISIGHKSTSFYLIVKTIKIKNISI
jgi:DNA-binding XRE family transcriptional regulator